MDNLSSSCSPQSPSANDPYIQHIRNLIPFLTGEGDTYVDWRLFFDEIEALAKLGSVMAKRWLGFCFNNHRGLPVDWKMDNAMLDFSLDLEDYEVIGGVVMKRGLASQKELERDCGLSKGP